MTGVVPYIYYYHQWNDDATFLSVYTCTKYWQDVVEGSFPSKYSWCYQTVVPCVVGLSRIKVCHVVSAENVPTVWKVHIEDLTSEASYLCCSKHVFATAFGPGREWQSAAMTVGKFYSRVDDTILVPMKDNVLVYLKWNSVALYRQEVLGYC